MLLSFIYHRITKENYPLIEEHLDHIAKHYPILLPGDKLQKSRTEICLTFDDGTFDFYYYIFPLLQKWKIKAVLAISPATILDQTSKSFEERLTLSTDNRAAYCTWEEIRSMDQSGLVHIASHSFSHKNLLTLGIDLEKEIFYSKKMIEEKIASKVITFVYPFGKLNKRVHEKVKNHYSYIMRIGSALNFSWKNHNQLLYRIVADHIKNADQLFRKKHFISYLWFYLLNSIRKR